MQHSTQPDHVRIGSIVMRYREYGRMVEFWRAALRYTTDQKAEGERLVKIGAARYPWRYGPGADYIVLEDPDGNLFCVVQLPEPRP